MCDCFRLFASITPTGVASCPYATPSYYRLVLCGADHPVQHMALLSVLQCRGCFSEDHHHIDHCCFLLTSAEYLSSHHHVAFHIWPTRICLVLVGTAQQRRSKLTSASATYAECTSRQQKNFRSLETSSVLSESAIAGWHHGIHSSCKQSMHAVSSAVAY